MLVVDWGPREGWDAGAPGRARGALVPLDPRTAAELPEYAPFNVGQAGAVTPSPDGRWLAIQHIPDQSGPSEFALLDRGTWEAVPLSGIAPHGIDQLAWSPDSRRAYLWNGSVGRLWVADTRSRSVEVLAALPLHTWAPLEVAPDGETLYVFAHASQQCCGIAVEGDPYVVVVDVTDGSELRRIVLPGLVTGQRRESLFEHQPDYNVLRSPAVAVAPDGRRLYVAHADSARVTVVDLDRGKVDRTVDVAPPASAFSQIGSWLLDRFASRAEAKGGIYYTRQAAISSDGRRLYATGTADVACSEQPYAGCTSGTPVGLQVIDTETLDVLAEFEGISRVVVTADGRWLLGTGWEHDYRDSHADWATEVGYGLAVIDAQTLEVVERFQPETALTQLAASPDSRFAYLVSNGPGRRESMQNGGRCAEACYALHVLRLPDAKLVATRDFFGWLELVDLNGFARAIDE